MGFGNEDIGLKVSSWPGVWLLVWHRVLVLNKGFWISAVRHGLWRDMKAKCLHVEIGRAVLN